MWQVLNPEKGTDYPEKQKEVFLYHQAIYLLIYEDKIKGVDLLKLLVRQSQ